MDEKHIADRLAKKVVARSRGGADGVSRKRTSIVFDKGDFRNKQTWYGMLDMLDIPYGEESNWDEPTSVDVSIVKAEYY